MAVLTSYSNHAREVTTDAFSIIVVMSLSFLLSRFGFVLFQGLLRQHQSSLSSSQLHDVRVKWLNFILSLLF